MSTFAKIKEKVRLLTKRTQVSQLSEASLKEYVNTFYLYDFPQIVKTRDLKKNISFATTPYVDAYSTTNGAYILNLKDFVDFVVTTDTTVYVSGQQIQLFQSPEQFNNTYYSTKARGSFGTGDGVTTNFTYTLPTKVLHRSVILGSVNAAGAALIVKDEPDTDAFEREANTGELRDQANNNIGTINYITGAIDVTFPSAPANGEDITYELFTFNPSLPTGILFFDNTFTLRPVPDKVYEVKLEVSVQPGEFDLDTDVPLVRQWWQFIAYGTAKKILEDSSDYEMLANIMPEYDRQKILVMRKTERDLSKERSKTIYNTSQNIANDWRYYG